MGGKRRVVDVDAVVCGADQLVYSRSLGSVSRARTRFLVCALQTRDRIPFDEVASSGWSRRIVLHMER